MDIRTGKGVCRNVDDMFYSASTVKAPYMASVYSYSLGGDMGLSIHGIPHVTTLLFTPPTPTMARCVVRSALLGFLNGCALRGFFRGLSGVVSVFFSAGIGEDVVADVL